MATSRRLGVFIDECISGQVARMLRDFRAPLSAHVRGSSELELRGVSDEVLFRELQRQGFAAIVTKDSAILEASLRRDAWRATDLHVFIMHGSCGNLTLFEQTRCLIWWWPAIAKEVQQDQPGTAWTIGRQLSGELKRRF